MTIIINGIAGAVRGEFVATERWHKRPQAASNQYKILFLMDEERCEWDIARWGNSI